MKSIILFFFIIWINICIFCEYFAIIFIWMFSKLEGIIVFVH